MSKDVVLPEPMISDPALQWFSLPDNPESHHIILICKLLNTIAKICRAKDIYIGCADYQRSQKRY
jgi:hypothetical protein